MVLYWAITPRWARQLAEHVRVTSQEVALPRKSLLRQIKLAAVIRKPENDEEGAIQVLSTIDRVTKRIPSSIYCDPIT